MDTAISAASCHLRLALSCARLGRVYTLTLQRLRGTKRTGPGVPKREEFPVRFPNTFPTGLRSSLSELSSLLSQLTL